MIDIVFEVDLNKDWFCIFISNRNIWIYIIVFKKDISGLLRMDSAGQGRATDKGCFIVFTNYFYRKTN